MYQALHTMLRPDSVLLALWLLPNTTQQPLLTLQVDVLASALGHNIDCARQSASPAYQHAFEKKMSPDVRTPAAHGAHLAMDVLHGEADLHKVQHDGILRQQLPFLSFEVLAQVSILHAVSCVMQSSRQE